ncbi:MAG: hypothetical protein QM743_08285 [Chitinophagaceae bacterium]
MLTVLVIACATGFAAPAQTDAPPYRIHSTLPAFSIRLIDGGYFNTARIRKGSPSVLMLVSPDCHHCSALVRELKDSLAAISNVNFVLASPPMLFEEIQKFAVVNGIARQGQLKIGQDTAFFFGSFFHAGTVPFVVVYDRQKKWFSTLSAMNHISELLAELRKVP